MITILDFLHNYFEILTIILVIIVYLIIEYFLRKKLKNFEKELHKKYDISLENQKTVKVANIENIKQEDQVFYYKNKNILFLIRYLAVFIIITLIIIYKIPNFFNFFAIAVWAIIIAFKELILCFFAYFYIATIYKIWDNLMIWEWASELKWEIIYVNLLNIWIIWKDDFWEHNWKFYRIPNYKFFTENIKKEDIWIDKYKKVEIKILFSKDNFSVSLDDFSKKLSHHLDELLPKKWINNVWNYKSFIWYKYKLRFTYEEDKFFVKIIFIEKPKNIFEIEKNIFSYIESLKK